ncbi:hypothetical protein PANT_9d00236 [Moesziomyces antarcticus T-34]|uniref:Uncharacterized protein n=1 Tax=Pseudozyma antarctica (strain T-34) TaxID=1151754 RepID=M9LP05_PSEA3|nr:hypothetical protein PANT_9d00236 [Moesziomyces antarcticus T-34]
MSCGANDSSEPGSHDNDAKHNPTTQTAVALTDMAANRIFETPASSPPNEATFNNDARTAPAQLSSAQLSSGSSSAQRDLFLFGLAGGGMRSSLVESPNPPCFAKLGVAPFRESINPKRLEDQGPGGREKKRSAEEEGGGGGGTGIRTRTPAQIRSGWAERSGGAFQRAGSGILPSSSASELTSSARAQALEQHGLLGSAKTSQTRQLSSIFDFDRMEGAAPSRVAE